MPQIGPMEILVVSVLGLIVFGPDKLPEIARSLGRMIADLKRQGSQLKAEFESGFDDAPWQAPGDATPADRLDGPGARDEAAPAPPITDPPRRSGHPLEGGPRAVPGRAGPGGAAAEAEPSAATPHGV
ncbi:MAG: twin-arginine translocase TatA/TatE family subunit, partial [Actinomycetota bacterium]|nr:twin-arginine translocase TatA/TatE family subunit [Actinomycetota bacterium]